jgi:1,2-phenylacetyl-CoA epoxidase catalytic subunit
VQRAEIQRRFKKWFVASMRIFGRAGTPGNQYCLSVGLKSRDSGDVAAAYIDSIRPVMQRCGLRFPDRSELSLELPPQVDLTVTPGVVEAGATSSRT